MLLKTLSAGAPTNSAQRLHHSAILDAVVFHLMCGYQNYLRELAENYRVVNFSLIDSEASLLSALDLIGKVPSEAVELSNLRHQPSSWLTQLHSYYESLWLASDLGPPVNKASPENVIPLVSLDEESFTHPRVQLEQVTVWEKAFSELIARQRETSCEY